MKWHSQFHTIPTGGKMWFQLGWPWIPQLRRCDRFQVASEEVFPSCQTKLASLQALLRWAAWTQTHQQLGTLPRNGNARKRQEEGIKMNQGKKKGAIHRMMKIEKREGEQDPKQQLPMDTLKVEPTLAIQRFSHFWLSDLWWKYGEPHANDADPGTI